jgi:CheY-like chemotaxis protein
MGSILIIDDNEAFLQLLQDYVRQHHPSLTVMTCNDPIKCLARISTDLDLLLVDLEMPGLDGSKVLAYATAKGLDKNRIIVLSAHDADYLHRRFPLGSCLAVLNKEEAKQNEVLEMVFTSLERNKGCLPGAGGTPCPAK